MRLREENVARIDSLRFYNEETRSEETVLCVRRPCLTGGRLVFWTLDGAWRSVAPEDIREINGNPAEEFLSPY